MILGNKIIKLALPGAPQLNVDLIFYPAAIQNSLSNRDEKTIIQTRRISDRVEPFYIPLHMTRSLIRRTTNVMYCHSLQGHACNADLDPPKTGPPERTPFLVYIYHLESSPSQI